jgi:hypothetical protein
MFVYITDHFHRKTHNFCSAVFFFLAHICKLLYTYPIFPTDHFTQKICVFRSADFFWDMPYRKNKELYRFRPTISCGLGVFGESPYFFTDYEKEPPPTVDRAWVLPPIAIYPYMPLNTNFRKNLKQSCDQIWAKMGHFWAILGVPVLTCF